MIELKKEFHLVGLFVANKSISSPIIPVVIAVGALGLPVLFLNKLVANGIGGS